MSIQVYAGASRPVLHAANRLSAATSLPIQGTPEPKQVRLSIAPDPSIGTQGYAILSEAPSLVHVRGRSDEGVANGVFTLLRKLTVAGATDPFHQTWNVVETPRFSLRGMVVCPYRFGGAYGFPNLSPDRWSVDEWKQYVDTMRFCNMNVLTLASLRPYHPRYPESHRERWRYEVWREVMRYCQQVGIRFHVMTTPNLVPQEAFWSSPESERAEQRPMWFGNGLIWSTARQKIAEVRDFTLEWFAGMDGLEMIYMDGGGMSYDPVTKSDPATYFSEATNEAIDGLRRSSGADFVFWNWYMSYWSSLFLKVAGVSFPKGDTLQDDIVAKIPRDALFLDASLLTLHQVFKAALDKEKPALREGLEIGRDHGFRAVIDFFYFMNKEESINMFPHPFIERSIQEARYADKLGIDGVAGYRLSPACRFLSDYAFFRLASEPDLERQELVDEMVALLGFTGGGPQRAQAAQAINDLEDAWQADKTHWPSAMKAAKMFASSASTLDSLADANPSPRLRSIADGLWFFGRLLDVALNGPAGRKERDSVIGSLYEDAQCRPTFRGLTTDIVWQPESRAMFIARVEIMLEELGKVEEMPDVVDETAILTPAPGPIV